MTSALPTHPEEHHHGRRRLPRFKGVRRRRWGRWVAEIRVPNSRDRLWLGSYPSAHQAARAYDVAAACLRGSSAVLNLPSLSLPAQTPACISPTSIRNLAAQEAARFSSHHHRPLHSESPNSPSFDRQLTSPLPLSSSSLTLLPAAHSELDCGSSHDQPLGELFKQDDGVGLLSQSEQPPSHVPDVSPSLLDLWFSLDVGPNVDPRLKALLNHSLYPENGNQ